MNSLFPIFNSLQPRAKIFLRLLAHLLFWTVFGLLMAWAVAGRAAGMTWTEVLTKEMIYSYLWMSLTPVIFLIVRHFPLFSRDWLRNGGIHIVCSVGISLVQRYLYGYLVAVYETGKFPALTQPLCDLWWFIDYAVTIYFVIVGAVSALTYYRKSREHEMRSAALMAQLAQAQLQALRMQLQPHFLFNTLNAISVLVESDPAAARTMISRLADLLRMTLDLGSEQKIPLRRELEILKMYLDIESTRFPERLRVKIAPGDATLDALVPTLLLQPLVENAIRHGVAKNRSMTTVTVRSEHNGDVLQLDIGDDGPGVTGPQGIREGIGLTNTRARLERLYGNTAGLALAVPGGRGFSASIRLPFETKPINGTGTA